MMPSIHLDSSRHDGVYPFVAICRVDLVSTINPPSTCNAVPTPRVRLAQCNRRLPGFASAVKTASRSSRASATFTLMPSETG